MRSSVLVKINFLVLIFLGVLFVMHKMNSGGFRDGIAMLMGVDPSRAAVAVPSGQVITQMDWCDTRVKSLERPGKPKLHQEKLKWLWASQPELELNFIAVEKWFGRYCRVQIERVDPAEFGTAGPALLVEFIKGAPETLMRTVNGVYQWRQEIFRSKELDQALTDLEQLPSSGARTTR